MIEPKKSGIRKIPGTVLVNGLGKTIYTPPVGERIIRDLLSNLEKYINTDDEIDPLIKLGIIHYQFESIHPFGDGNGRTGRILMILYLVLQNLLTLPILYLSEYINAHKVDYYKALNNVRAKKDRDGLVLYMLIAIEQQSKITTEKLEKITKLIRSTVQKAESVKLKIPYGFIVMLFDRPYNNIKSLEKEGKYARNTIRNYLRQLESKGIVNRIEDEINKPYAIPEYLKILYNKKQ